MLSMFDVWQIEVTWFHVDSFVALSLISEKKDNVFLYKVQSNFLSSDIILQLL